MAENRVDPNQFLRSNELAQLARNGVSITSTGLAFARELGERDLRTVWRAVAAVSRRSSKAEWTNWLVGDWANETTSRLGAGSNIRIIREEETEFQYMQHLLRLAGATIYSLQLTELTIEICCRFLAPDQMEVAPGTVFNADAAVRRKTLGQLSKLLKDRQIFIEAFEQRMNRFVEHRNRFTHKMWIDDYRDDQQDHNGRVTLLRSRERFMLDLLVESDSIGKILNGHFVAIGVSIADQDFVTLLGDEGAEWTGHLAEFEKVRRTVEPSTG